MDQKLKGFFDTAQKKADETTAAQTAAADAAAQRAKLRAENQQELRRQIDEELGPILDIVASLPEKNGTRFSTYINGNRLDSDVEARYLVNVSYRNPNEHRYDHCDEYDRWQPEISMNITRQADGRLAFGVTQSSILERNSSGNPRHKYVRVTDFEAARQELAIGLGTFAADRMAEIGTALGATTPEPAATAPATPGDASTIEVFRKPLAFKGAAQRSATPDKADETPQVAASTATATAKKPRWKFW